MRIGVVTTSYPHSVATNAGSFVMHLAHAIAKRGHHIEVCAPEPATAPAHNSSQSHVLTHWIPYLRPRRWQRTCYGAGVLDNLRSDPLAWCGVVPCVLALDHGVSRRAHQWDAVLSHWALPCALIAAGHRRNRPHVTVLHSADVHLLRHLPFASRLARKILSGSDHLVFVSDALKKLFRSQLGASAHDAFDRKAHVMPMGFTAPCGLDTTREMLRAQHGMRRFTVLILARLVPIKGVDVALTALSGISDLECWVAGDGPQRNQLQALASQLNISVRWLGHVSSHVRDQLLKAADVLVAPSRVLCSGRTEGMPCSVIEAMHAGLPVIASAVGGIPEWVRHQQTGCLVPPDEPIALREEIQYLQRNPSQGMRYAAQARQKVQHLSWNDQAVFYERLLTAKQ